MERVDPVTVAAPHAMSVSRSEIVAFVMMVAFLVVAPFFVYPMFLTLALAQMMFFFALQMKVTGGEDGIQGVPRGKILGLIDLSNQTNMYITVVVIFLAGFLLIYRIIHSPFGEVLKAIRENEARAISLGYK